MTLEQEMEKLEEQLNEVSDLVGKGIDMDKNVELCDKIIDKISILEKIIKLGLTKKEYYKTTQTQEELDEIKVQLDKLNDEINRLKQYIGDYNRTIDINPNTIYIIQLNTKDGMLKQKVST